MSILQTLKDNKYVIVGSFVVILVAFGIGRWSAPEKVKVETKTVVVTKEVDKTVTNKDIHKKTTVTETQKPDGTKTTTTVITYEDTSTINNSKTESSSSSSETLKEVTKSSSKLIISAMAGANLSFSDLGTPIYGGSVQKTVIGPITLGVWGFSNKTGGLSVGLIF